MTTAYPGTVSFAGISTPINLSVTLPFSTVQFSTNLSNWFDLGPATPRYDLTDTNAPAVPQRYYRLR